MYKILIADDEQLERDALRAIINKGVDSIIEIQEAVNGREAIVKARTFRPDIIFLDIKMPGINGIESARTIREEDPSVCIVFLTAYNQFEYAHEAIEIGVDNFIIKPSSETRVLEVIKKSIINIDKQKFNANLKKDNEIRLSRATGYLENEFVYNLSVRSINEEKFENYLSILDIDFYSARAGIVKLNYSTYPIHIDNNYQKQVLRKKTVYVIKSILSEYGLITLFNMELSNIYFLTIKQNDNKYKLVEHDIDRLISEISERIKNSINLDAIISIGSVFYNPPESYKSFSIAKNNLAGISDISPHFRAMSDGATFPLNLEIELEQEILKGNRDEAFRTFQKLSNWFEISELDFENKKKSIIELSTVIKHAAAYQLPDGICTVDEGNMREALSSETLLSDLSIFLNKLLEKTASVNNLDNSPAIESATRFIENNFRKDITLEETASYCRLSSFYFSKLFKKNKGITFIDFLTVCRISEAKRLLEFSNLSMKEISNEIGYSDPNYFTRVFKRIEKVSPTTFRGKKMLNQQYSEETR